MDQQVMQQRPAARPENTPPGKQMAGPDHARLTQIAATLNTGQVAQRAPNRTGLPDGLKAGVEALSGISLDHVRVHYNSGRPAQLNAHAYAQGGDIHLAPGQRQHLPHEAWHAVQQAQGRVKPTMQMKGSVPVNDDAALEHEADVMGAQALTTRALSAGSSMEPDVVARPPRSPAGGRTVQRVGGQKFGLEASDTQKEGDMLAGFDDLKKIQAQYKNHVKTTKEAAITAFKASGMLEDPATQAVYTTALKAAEMTASGLADLWKAAGRNHTWVGGVFIYKATPIATVRSGPEAYVESEAATPGKSAIYKRHTLDGPSADEYVKIGNEHLRRHAYRGITPPERRAFKTGQDLIPGNSGERTGQMGHNFDRQTGEPSDRIRDVSQSKVNDLEWLNSHGGNNLAQTPNDSKSLSFLQVRKGVGKAFSATSTSKPITSNAGAEFAGFGRIKIDLARVPPENVLHNYKTDPLDANTLNQAIGGHGQPHHRLGQEINRANQTVARNREIVLSRIPHAAVAHLDDSVSRSDYEQVFRAQYIPKYKKAYAREMTGAGLSDPSPMPNQFPWVEDHFTERQAHKDFRLSDEWANARSDAAPRVMFAKDYREAYPKGWQAGYEEGAWASPYFMDHPGVEEIEDVPKPPLAPAPGVGTVDGTRSGYLAGKEAGNEAGLNYTGPAIIQDAVDESDDAQDTEAEKPKTKGKAEKPGKKGKAAKKSRGGKG